MTAVKGNLADNQMGIKVGLLVTRQKTLCPPPPPSPPPPEELCSREEGKLQADYIQREDKLNVSNAFRAGNSKNYLTQWSFITSNKLLSKQTFFLTKEFETVKWELKIDLNTLHKCLTQQRKVKLFQKKLQNY